MLLEELQWRGLLQDMSAGVEELLSNQKLTVYAGFDPTADSLHIGNLVPIMLLKHFQIHGHTPIALVGGATGMVGDPSGKSQERNFLSEEILRHNQDCIQQQLSRFLDFEEAGNKAKLVNNYDWFKAIGFLDFIREVGKHITVNYMMAKDSVKSRLEGGNGISFTEFSYQLLQGYDFYHLWKNYGCNMQIGGSDQWGNIVTGTELIRRMSGGEAYALTAPLVKKSDGGKFGKTEKGNIWLDSKKTSPYKFYQFWRNISDEDAIHWIKIFSLKNKEAITSTMQKALAEEMTMRIHGREALESAISASEVLFGRATSEHLMQLSSEEVTDIFEGVPTFTIDKNIFMETIPVLDLLAVHTTFLSSKGDARRQLQSNAIAINQKKVSIDTIITMNDCISNRYIILRKGKKDYALVSVE
jgi:tyrosyl-tRNA synthetase